VFVTLVSVAFVNPDSTSAPTDDPLNPNPEETVKDKTKDTVGMRHGKCLPLTTHRYYHCGTCTYSLTKVFPQMILC